jgi:hypothetical protein
LFRCLPPSDNQLSSWLIVKSLHQPRRLPLFVTVAARLPPPAALLALLSLLPPAILSLLLLPPHNTLLSLRG